MGPFSLRVRVVREAGASDDGEEAFLARPAGRRSPWTEGDAMGNKESRIGFLSYDEALRRGE